MNAESGLKSYTPREVAKILGVSVFTVQELLREGRLKGFKITSHWRISEDELQKFMGVERGNDCE